MVSGKNWVAIDCDNNKQTGIPDNIRIGKNWMAIDCDNNGQTDRASEYLYMHMQTVSLVVLASQVFQII